jgi:uncharacterized Zn finger protein (UPF0148 family)
MEEQMCPECGFPMDEGNESQPVCPRCGADPAEHQDSAVPRTLTLPAAPFEEILAIFRPQRVITSGNNLIH